MIYVLRAFDIGCISVALLVMYREQRIDGNPFIFRPIPLSRCFRYLTVSFDMCLMLADRLFAFSRHCLMVLGM